MKIFTKIMLILAGIMAAIGTVCLVIACTMGLNWAVFRNMVLDGKFSFSIDDGFIWHWEDDEEETDTGTEYFVENITKLDIQFGAGKLEICYGDVENIVVEHGNVIRYEAEVEKETLFIQGGLGINHSNHNASLKITIPQGMKLDEVDLEIGASSATIADLLTDTLNIAVGAGEAEITRLDVKKLKAEVGMGELSIGLVGEKEDYSYSVECGIGSIVIGDSSYGGMGTSQNVKNEEAERYMDIDCGIGEVAIRFVK